MMEVFFSCTWGFELGSLGNKALKIKWSKDLERCVGCFRSERMSAKGEKSVGNSPVFIGQTGGAESRAGPLK